MTEDANILRAAYFTLGCKLNFAETSTIGKILSGKGIMKAAAGETPDIIVINTCSVTEMADKKGRRLIRHLAARHPAATIIVTGCYAQLKPQEVASISGVDIVLGSNEKLRMAEYVEEWLKDRAPRLEVTPPLEIKEFRPSCEHGERTRYFLKVQDGCDYFCTYCTIPFARGRSRSGNISSLTDMARKVADEGGKEIVITGVNIGCFGLDTGESFFELLKSLDKVNGIERYRISSIEPNLLTEDIIHWTATEARAFMPHFHIPLQSGSDTVLRLMNRRYDTSLFRKRIDLIRQLVPDAFIGVDIIAGARGETAEEWKKSYDFAESLDVTRFHIFPYSERPGTKALSLDQIVTQKEKHRRVALLSTLSDSKLRAFSEKNIGTVRPVLWEHSSGEEIMQGLTDNYLRVSVEASALPPDCINTITEVRLSSIDEMDPENILGTPVNS